MDDGWGRWMKDRMCMDGFYRMMRRRLLCALGNNGRFLKPPSYPWVLQAPRGASMAHKHDAALSKIPREERGRSVSHVAGCKQ